MSRMPVVSTIAAVRGAVTVPSTPPARSAPPRHGCSEALLRLNRLEPGQVVSALFTTTPGSRCRLSGARGACSDGMTCHCSAHARSCRPGRCPGVVRVLLTVRDVAAPRRLRPVYLGGAAALRPDLTGARRGHAKSPRRGATRVMLVGLGQIGGSLGLALADSGWWRSGYDVRAGARRDALRAGAVDRIGSLASRRLCRRGPRGGRGAHGPHGADDRRRRGSAAARRRACSTPGARSARALVPALLRARAGAACRRWAATRSLDRRGAASPRAPICSTGATFCVTPLGHPTPAAVREPDPPRRRTIEAHRPGRARPRRWRAPVISRIWWRAQCAIWQVGRDARPPAELRRHDAGRRQRSGDGRSLPPRQRRRDRRRVAAYARGARSARRAARARRTGVMRVRALTPRGRCYGPRPSKGVASADSLAHAAQRGLHRWSLKRRACWSSSRRACAEAVSERRRRPAADARTGGASHRP